MNQVKYLSAQRIIHVNHIRKYYQKLCFPAQTQKASHQLKLISSGFKSHVVAKVPCSSCSRDRALMKSCHGVARVAGGVSKWFLVVDPPFYCHAHQAHSRALVCMVYFRPATREVVSCRNLTQLLTNSLAISPLVFTLGFATKTKSRQLRRLAIGSAGSRCFL